MKQGCLIVGVVLCLPILLIGGLLIVAGSAMEATCGQNVSVRADLDDLPGVEGFDEEQLGNAAQIIAAGVSAGVSLRDQQIAVMTAIGESTLRVLDYGDVAGPDSRGLFQQRDSWGPLSVRMDAYASAGLFYERLVLVESRDLMAPTLVAHTVQRNADPDHYARFWDAAVRVVAGLSGVQLLSECAIAPGVVGLQGWANPVVGPITSAFGGRDHPITGVSGGHFGTDVGAGCDSPIYATGDGLVTVAGAMSGYGHVIFIDHGNEVSTRYGHMYASGVLVSAGEQVRAGQVIGLVGSDGDSTGCHLHFEVRTPNPIDPEVFLAERGVTLGGGA